MTTSLKEILQLPNVGHIETSTIDLDKLACDKILLVTL